MNSSRLPRRPTWKSQAVIRKRWVKAKPAIRHCCASPASMRSSVERLEVTVKHAEVVRELRFDQDDTNSRQGIPWMNDEIDSRSRSAKSRNGTGEQTLSPLAILV